MLLKCALAGSSSTWSPHPLCEGSAACDRCCHPLPRTWKQSTWPISMDDNPAPLERTGQQMASSATHPWKQLLLHPNLATPLVYRIGEDSNAQALYRRHPRRALSYSNKKRHHSLYAAGHVSGETSCHGGSRDNPVGHPDGLVSSPSPSSLASIQPVSSAAEPAPARCPHVAPAVGGAQ